MLPVTAEELYKLYNEENLSQREIGEKFDVSQSTVSKWMTELEIDSNASKPWSQKEKDSLKNNYPGNKSDILALFPERSWNAIKLKAMDLGLARSQEEYRKSNEVKEQLAELSKQNQIDVDFTKTNLLSYILGVIDGDGYHDNKGTIGLEVKDKVFSEKFVRKLEEFGLNPNTGKRRGKITVWASSQILVTWLMELDNKLEWLLDEGHPWLYIEGQYDSDGNLHPCGSPRICSYNEQEKEFLFELFTSLNIKTSIQQNNV